MSESVATIIVVLLGSYFLYSIVKRAVTAGILDAHHKLEHKVEVKSEYKWDEL